MNIFRFNLVQYVTGWIFKTLLLTNVIIIISLTQPTSDFAEYFEAFI